MERLRLGPNLILPPVFTVNGQHLAKNVPNLVRPDIPFALTVRLGVDAGRLRCEEFAVRPRPDGPPITTATLREVAIQRLISEYVSSFAEHVASVPGGYRITKARPDDLKRSRFGPPRRRTQPNDAELGALADRYRELSNAGIHGVYASLTREFGRSRTQLYRYLDEARRRGILGPPRRGWPGEMKPPAKRKGKR